MTITYEEYYRRRPDVKAANMDAHHHWEHFGRNEGMPEPVAENCSEAEYFRRRPDVAASGMSAQEHYLHFGKAEGMCNPGTPSTGEICSPEEYMRRRPDVLASGMTAANHYKYFGKNEGMCNPTGIVAPTPTVNSCTPQEYLRQRPDVAASNMDALTHYTHFGKGEGMCNPILASEPGPSPPPPTTSGLLPPRSAGYAMSNYWWQTNPNDLATHIRNAGLNLTLIEFVPYLSPQARWSQAIAYVNSMRSKGIWTIITALNWNQGCCGAPANEDICRPEYSDNWYRELVRGIRNRIGTNMVILLPMSEWDYKGGSCRNNQCGDKAARWHSIAKQEWPGLFSWNRTSRPKSTEGYGDYFEYHPFFTSDTGPNGCILVTDTGNILRYFKGGTNLYDIPQHVLPHRLPALQDYAMRVLDHGKHFVWYSYNDRSPDINAMLRVGWARAGR